MARKSMRSERLLSETLFKLMRTMKRRPGASPRSSRRYNHLLALINESDGLKSSELAELMDIRPSSLTEMLHNLERDKMISRRQDANDMRVTRVYIEERGCRRLETIKSSENDFFSNILTVEEEAMFIGLCDKLIEGIAKRSETFDSEDSEH